MELRDTIPGMLSLDYKERFTAEYEQLSIRALKLETFIDNYRHSRLSFKPTCNIELLEQKLDISRQQAVNLLLRKRL